MYLLGLMNWLRTELGEPVEAVYGFYFCGHRCENQKNTYSVALIKLSAPKWLGEELKAETFVVTDETINLLPMRFLIHFLKHGKQWSISDSGRVDESRRIPSLFTLPTSLWQDDGGERRLVLNTASSIVFHVSGQGLTSLL
jgi:hypothetical protein